MKRVAHIAKNHEEARQCDIKQAIEMTVEERQEAAAALKQRVYGDVPDVRAWHKNKKK
jgi:predicted transcriptional regulator